MAKKKAGARKRAEDFIQAIGTAGGALGSPGLVQFGAGDIQRQVALGQSDEYAAYRAQDMQAGLGSPNAPSIPMPRDLDLAYLKLNLPGSPLPQNAMFMPQNLAIAEAQQGAIGAQAQQFLAQQMPMTGQLPMGLPQPKSKKGS